MKDSVSWMAGVTACTGMMVGIAMVLLGMEPRLVLVGCVVVIVAVTGRLVIDLGVAASSVVWHNHDTVTGASARPDRRVEVLRARLRQPAYRRAASRVVETDGDESANEIVDTLVGVIDDHLQADHGLDKSIDPAAAAEVLGPDLTRFVTDPAARRSMTQRRSLARTLALIEDL